MSVIVNTIVGALATILQEILVFFLDYMTKLLQLDKFTPNYTFFIKSFLGTDEKFQNIIKIFMYLGLTIMLLIFFFKLFLYTFGNIVEIKDSILQMIMRLFITVAVILSGAVFCDQIANVFETLYKTAEFSDLFNKVTAFSLADGTSVWSNMFTRSQSALETGTEAVGLLIAPELLAMFAAAAVIIGILKLIINICFLFILGYSTIKLMFELIQRYVLSVALYMVFPLIASTIVSSTTQQIFMAYLSMYLGQVVLLIITRLWINLTIYFIARVPITFLNMVIIIAWARIGTQFETYMKSMKMDAPQSGRSLLDTISATGLAAYGMARMATGSAKVARSGIGHVSTSAGASSGNAKLLAAGNVALGKGINPHDLAQSATSSPYFKGKYTDDLGQLAANSFGEGTRKGYQAAGDLLGAMKAQEDKDKMLGYIKQDSFGDSVFGTDGLLGGKADISIDPQSGKKMLDIDSNGIFKGRMNFKDGTVADFSISDTKKDAKAVPFIDDHGNEKFISFDPGNNQNSGMTGKDSKSFDYAPGQLSSAEISTGIRGDEIAGLNPGDKVTLSSAADGGTNLFVGEDGENGLSYAHISNRGETFYRGDTITSDADSGLTSVISKGPEYADFESGGFMEYSGISNIQDITEIDPYHYEVTGTDTSTGSIGTWSMTNACDDFLTDKGTICRDSASNVAFKVTKKMHTD